LAVHGVRFPYVFEREMKFLAPDRLALRYRATNHAAVELPYIWSAHPLFAVTAATRILLPAGVTALTLNSSMSGRLGRPYRTVGWPAATDGEGRAVDLSRLTPGAGHGDKLYTTAPLDEGWCALYDEATGTYAGFAFDPREVPHLGVWINQDGWPTQGPTCFNVALEPCTGWPDDLAQAAERGTMRVLPAYGSHTWTVVLTAGRASSAAQLSPARWLDGAGGM
jgi:galactose mutarotase-like enzyme